ncbi:DUF3168 domain-containing protein [Anaeromusa sp.]|uniref:DUF3168 domain-containing protein n=1 Tax=Anaeromusa sp. TaxID=1872520 RepID=UPI0026353FD7|nr:DUF3168 domain-containing protein [Anaeromusa sp.]MDD3157670.1 DUF3168 domain-containing protein [Anaeromusa sp.]
MIIRRIPMNALQKGVYSILSTKQTTPVYDDVPPEAVLPYVTLGAFTCKRNGGKTTDIADVSQQIHVWSAYEGKREVNDIADDVTAVLTAWPLDLAADGFSVFEQDVDFFEAFEEEEGGYHGVITFVCRVQNTGI